MIDKYDFIKHEKFMDVALEVEYVMDMGDHLKVTGYWWNQGFTKSWMVPFKNKKISERSRRPYGQFSGADMQTFDIRKSDLPKWSKLMLPRKDADCLRNCGWEPCT
jgi:hypothetical protein